MLLGVWKCVSQSSTTISHKTLVEKLSFVTISSQLGRVIPNIRVNLDASLRTFMSQTIATFLVILDKLNVAKDHVFY